MRLSDITEAQYSTYLRGVNDGEQNAINACFGAFRGIPPFDSRENTTCICRATTPAMLQLTD